MQGSLWRFLRAGCFVAAGITLLVWPLTGIVTLAFVLGLMFLLDGSLRLASALQMEHRRGFVVLDGVLGIPLGIIILSRWHADSAILPGIIVGIRLIMGGFLAMVIGAGLRTLKIGGDENQ